MTESIESRKLAYMFYHLLVPLAGEASFLNLFRYITFRAGGALLTALLICLWIGPPVINWLKRQQPDGQPIRSDGPESHFSKKGTPTMGGLMILLSIIITTLLWSDWGNAYVWVVLAVTLAFGLLGGLDDYLKLTKKNTAGFSAKWRLGLGALASGAAAYAIATISPPELANQLAVPMLKTFLLDLGILFIPFGICVIMGAANAVNFTDGLDGLVSMPLVTTALSFGIIVYVVGNAKFADYLQLHPVPGAGELAIICTALAGAVLGFLWYNAPPAQVFMGDTGSLSLGAALGTMALIVKHEIVLAIIGGLFVVETLSVIIQVASFKVTGKRVFLMAPIHHHFEKRGWPETKIVIRFWIISCVLALIGLATLKIR